MKMSVSFTTTTSIRHVQKESTSRAGPAKMEWGIIPIHGDDEGSRSGRRLDGRFETVVLSHSKRPASHSFLKPPETTRKETLFQSSSFLPLFRFCIFPTLAVLDLFSFAYLS
jgi:hypothetical protein